VFSSPDYHATLVPHSSPTRRSSDLVASLLWDPYHRLDDAVRERLVDYYLAEMKAREPHSLDEKTFLESLVACRLQRHMQATRLRSEEHTSELQSRGHHVCRLPLERK